VMGSLDNLAGLGHIQVAGGSIYGEPYRSLSADLQFQGKQVDLRNLILQQDGARVTGGGNYNFDTKVFAFNATGSNFDLAHLAKLDFDPLLRAYLPGKVTGHSSVSGNFVLRGPLKNPGDIAVQGDVDQFQADVQHIQLHNEGPLRFSISNQVASVEQMHIVGTDTDITGTGKVELAGAGRLDLHANGKVNLGILQTVNPAVSSSGQMTFTVNGTGRLN